MKKDMHMEVKPMPEEEFTSSIISNSNQQYKDIPKYQQYTGEALEDDSKLVIWDLGFDVYPHELHENGADITIPNYNAKFELLNFRDTSYISTKRALSIRNNLKRARFKGIIVSFSGCLRFVRNILKNIPILVLGFQLLPTSKFFRERQSSYLWRTKLETDRGLKLLKNRILGFFYKIGLSKLVYNSRVSNSRISNIQKLTSPKIRNKNNREADLHQVSSVTPSNFNQNLNIMQPDCDLASEINEEIERTPTIVGVSEGLSKCLV